MKKYIWTLGLILMIIACSPEPVPIDFGSDECVNCKMIISDHRYGAEIVTKKGKALKFDAAECMAKFIYDKLISEEDIASLWVIDYGNPKNLTDAKKAHFLRSRSLPSPMAMYLTAFSDENILKETMKEHEGKVYDWDGIMQLIALEWGD